MTNLWGIEVGNHLNSLDTKQESKNTLTIEDKENLLQKWKKQAEKIKEIRTKADNHHKKESIQADNWLNIKLNSENNEKLDPIESKLVSNLQSNPKNFINIIKNEKEFEVMYDKIGAILMDNGEHITKKEIEKIKKDWPKNLRDNLVLLYWKDPKKFKDVNTILDGVNRNWLQNFFDKKTISFKDRINFLIKKLKIKKTNLIKKFPSFNHTPESEQEFLDAVKDYYSKTK